MEGITGYMYIDGELKIKIDEPLKSSLQLSASTLASQIDDGYVNRKLLIEFGELAKDILEYCEKTYGFNFNELYGEDLNQVSNDDDKNEIEK